MDLRTLETFLHVLRSGAVGKTALRLNVTQSAVSRRLQGFEQELGVTLFIPDGRGIRPTDAALLLVPHIEEAVKALEVIRSKAPLLEAKQQALRVAATPQTIASLLAPALPDLSDLGISLSFTEAGGADIADLVLQDICDCGITAYPAFETGLQSSQIGQLHLNAIGPSLAHMNVSRGEIDIADLLDAQLLVFDRTYQSRKVLNAAFAMQNQPCQIVYEGQSAHAILALVSAGAGLAVLPSNIATDLPSARITYQRRQLLIETTLVWHQSSRNLQGVVALEAVLQKLKTTHTSAALGPRTD